MSSARISSVPSFVFNRAIMPHVVSDAGLRRLPVLDPSATEMGTESSFSLRPDMLTRVLEKIQQQSPQTVAGPNAMVGRSKLTESKKIRHTGHYIFEKSRVQVLKFMARKLYRPLLMAWRRVMDHAGEIARKYILAHDPDFNHFRWGVIEKLFQHGKFKGAFGSVILPGMVIIGSKINANRLKHQRLLEQYHEIGSDLRLPDGTVIPVKRAFVGPMAGISGMSFPQLSAPAILTLLYLHIKHAKEGNRFLFNTGEGGPAFHLALFHGDRQDLREQVISWGIMTGDLQAGSMDMARVEVFLDDLMIMRDELFKEFSADDLSRAQIVAQFGTALNGIRGEEDRIDFNKLKKTGEDPAVAMIQYKLKQAAKRGSKLDVKKLDAVTAALREVNRGKDFKSPAISPEMETFEDIALLILATKIVTRKPVSLKFGVGDIENAYEFMEYLRDAGALPDHIQIDGSGTGMSPGSGNAPPTGTMGTTSLAINEATIVMDAILKHLGIRDSILMSVSGDVLLPVEGVEKLALGADFVDAARLWMGMGLGCSQVRACDDGNCPYGIASKNGSVFTLAFDPREVAPRAYLATKQWQQAYYINLTETGVLDWRTFRQTHGLHARRDHIYVRSARGREVPLKKYYNPQDIISILEEIMDVDEIMNAVYRYYPEEYQNYEIFDAARRMIKYIKSRASKDPSKQALVRAVILRKLQGLPALYASSRPSGKEIREYIRQDLSGLML